MKKDLNFCHHTKSQKLRKHLHDVLQMKDNEKNHCQKVGSFGGVKGQKKKMLDMRDYEAW